MKCIECKWYVGQVNDTYGVCKRFPQTANKSQHDWCGEYQSKVVVITPVQKEPVQKYEIKFEEPTEFEAQREGSYNAETGVFKPLKRGRKPKQ
jgi:hypothetical protein